MRTILNIIWFLFAGIELFIAYVFFGVIACIFIVTIPFGVAAARIGVYALWPFGQTVVDNPGPRPGALVGNVIWLVLCGWWLVLGHIATAIAQAITIVGIPLALANLKLIPVSLLPLGKQIVPVDQTHPAPAWQQ